MKPLLILTILALPSCGDGGLMASCSDGVKDRDETDLDCGGSCGPCAVGQGCKGAGDCRSANCTNSLCAAPSCSDGAKNGQESDVDCGGLCSGCPGGRHCLM